MATIDATPGSSSFGRIVDISNSPYSFTEAHHCSVDKSGKVQRVDSVQHDGEQQLLEPANSGKQLVPVNVYALPLSVRC
jgi:hypothetical protein